MSRVQRIRELLATSNISSDLTTMNNSLFSKSRTSHFVASVCLCISFLHSAALAENWVQTEIDAGPEAGSQCAIAIDRGGQVHVAYVKDGNPGRTLHYALKSTPGRTPAKEEISFGFTSLTGPAHVSIDVGESGLITIAYVGRDEKVGVFRKSPQDPAWTHADVAGDGFADPTGGVSVKKDVLVYTSASGSMSGPLKESRRTSVSSWSTPVELTSGTGSGLAPQLGAVNLPLSPLMLVFYNDNTKQIRSYTLISVSGGTPNWRTSESHIPDIDSFTRPSISIDQNGPPESRTVGVAFRDTDPPVIQFASRPFLESAQDWDLSTVAPEDENSLLQSFENAPVVFHDASGEPWVTYSRRLFLFRPPPASSTITTIDLNVKRFIPGIGWQRSTVESLNNPGTTGQIAVATNGAGDPALLFEAEPVSGTESSLTLLRPPNEPWVIENPQDDFIGNRQFAVAVAGNPYAKSFHVVADDSTTPVIGPITPRSARLLTYRGSTRTAVPIPNSVPDRSAHALAVTPDGSIHVVGRESSTGALSHDRFINDSLHQGTFPVTFEGVDSGISGPGNLSLASDGAGNLYLAFPRPGGGIRISRLRPGATTWEDVVQSSSGGTGIDLASRADGGIAVSHYDDDLHQVRVFTNTHPRTGAALPAFDDRLSHQLGFTNTGPPNTAIAFVGNTPRVAFAPGNGLLYLRPALQGTEDFEIFEPGSGLGGSTIDLIASGGKIQLLAFTPEDGGHCTLRGFKDTAPTDLLKNERFAEDVGALNPTNGEVGAAFDGHQFPVMISGIYRDLVIGSTRDLLIMRPADALDHDGDGVPLLFENAFVMNPSEEDTHLLPTTDASRSGLIERLSFTYRYPEAQRITVHQNNQVGEFLYSIALSPDLVEFQSDYSVDVGFLFFSREIIPLMELGVGADKLTLNIQPRFQLANPEMFGRLEVRRLKRDFR